MDYGRGVSEGVKIFLALVSVGLVAFLPALPKRLGQRLLLAVTVVAFVNYAQGGTKAFFKDIDAYDVIHYYLGAKYFDEIGYYDLYSALLLADAEAGAYDPGLKVFRFEDERGYHPNTPVDVGIQRGREVRELAFTEARWREFAHDAIVLQRTYGLGRGGWRRLVDDRGFNGTPAWIFVARPIAQLVPVEAAKLFCALDVLLLALALGFAAWAYGGRAALFGLLFLSTTHSLRWPYPSQAFLRYDWIAYLVIAMSLLKKAHHLPAGFLAGLSTLMRLFPAVWMFGPFVKGVARLVEHKGPLTARVDRRLLVLAGGFVAALLLVEGATAVVVGSDSIGEHFAGMDDHQKPEELTSRRVGFAIALIYDGKPTPNYLSREQKQAVADTKTLRTALALLVMLALGLALRKKRDDEAFAFGAVGFFMLTTASYYYFVARLTLAVLHASDLGKLRNRVGLAFLFALEVLTNGFQVAFGAQRVLLIGWLSWGLVAYTLTMIVLLFLEDRAPANGAETAADDEAQGDAGPGAAASDAA